MCRATARAAAVLCAAFALLAGHEAHAAARAPVKRPRRRPVVVVPVVAEAPPAIEAPAPPIPETPQPPTAPEEETVNRSEPQPTAQDDASAAPLEKRLELGGRLFTYIRAPLGDLDQPLQQLSSSLWLDLHARMTSATFATASVVGDLMSPSVEGKVEARARIREAYAGVHDSGVELRVGHQIISWGNADGVHAVDLLTAHDHSFYSVSGDARQIGAPSVQLSYSPDSGASPLKITAVWQPVFPQSKVLVPKGALPPFVRLLDEERPTPSLASSEAAIKIGLSPGGWDVAVIGFHGFNHLSEPYLKSIDAGIAQVGRAHHAIDAVGLQASVALDSWVLRAEAAYVVTENPDGLNRRIEPSHVDAIVGIERPLGDRVRIGVQGVVRAHPRYLPFAAPFRGAPEIAAAEREIAHVNAQIMNYTHQVRPGASLAIAYTSEDETLELSLAGLAYAVGFDWVVQPMIGYRLFESMKFDLGVQVFGGERNSLGFLSSQNGAFAQATYTF